MNLEDTKTLFTVVAQCSATYAAIIGGLVATKAINADAEAKSFSEELKRISMEPGRISVLRNCEQRSHRVCQGAGDIMQYLVVQKTAQLFVAEAALETRRLPEGIVGDMPQSIEILG